MKTSDQEEQPAVFQQVWLKKAPYQHMKVCLVLENDSTQLSAVELKYFIITGLKSLHGEVGAALDFDLLEYNEDTRTASLRVASRDLVKLWSSMTLLGFYQNQSCAFRVLQVSPDLLPKSSNSSDLQQDGLLVEESLEQI